MYFPWSPLEVTGTLFTIVFQNKGIAKLVFCKINVLNFLEILSFLHMKYISKLLIIPMCNIYFLNISYDVRSAQSLFKKKKMN